MATIRPLKRKRFRPGADPFSVYELQCLRALAMTMNDVVADSAETHDADHAFFLPLALMDVIEERCDRLVRAAKQRDDAEHARAKDGA